MSTNNLKVCVGVASCAPWLKEGIISLEDFSIKCKELGFNAIEPCDRSIKSNSPQYIRELKRFYSKIGMGLPCLDIRNDFTVKNYDEWISNVNHVINWLKVAQDLEIPVARIWTGTRSVDDNAPSKVYRAIEKLLPLAERFSVRLAVENHGGISSNPHFLVGLVEKFNSPFLGLCADFGHLASDDRYDGLELLLPYSFHVHAKTHGFLQNGEEIDIDYGRIMRIVEKHPNNKYFSIEFEGKVISIQDNLNGIVETHSLLKRHFRPSRIMENKISV